MTKIDTTVDNYSAKRKNEISIHTTSVNLKCTMSNERSHPYGNTCVMSPFYDLGMQIYYEQKRKKIDICQGLAVGVRRLKAKEIKFLLSSPKEMVT